jgi:hypothetical protein
MTTGSNKRFWNGSGIVNFHLFRTVVFYKSQSSATEGFPSRWSISLYVSLRPVDIKPQMINYCNLIFVSSAKKYCRTWCNVLYTVYTLYILFIYISVCRISITIRVTYCFLRLFFFATWCVNYPTSDHIEPVLRNHNHGFWWLLCGGGGGVLSYTISCTWRHG